MIIASTALEFIHNAITGLPPETGGILGSSDKVCIDEVVMDQHCTQNVRCCSYYPNVAFLNQRIQQWQTCGITFMGIFHTHFVGVKTLSQGDRQYINAIMRAMPEAVSTLYFPVYVLPERSLVCYRAKRTDGVVEIESDDLMIVDKTDMK